MKCEICGKEIETTFLKKIKGNYVKKNGKMYAVCNECFMKEGKEIKSKLS